MPKPSHLLIIGAMKAGTSSLFDLLSTHPKLLPSIRKEPEYFSEMQEHKFQVNTYDELWPTSSKGDGYIRLEASTGYTKYPQEKGVPRRIHGEKINPKFIYIVRDPFKRIESQINWGSIFPWFDPDIKPWEDTYIATTLYSKQLAQYEKFFDPKDILILEFDDMRLHPEKICKKVSTFLAITNDFNLLTLKKIKNETQAETKLQRYILRNSKRRKLFFRLPVRIRKIIKKRIFPLSKPASKIILSESDKHKINDKIWEDMIRLRDKYEVDISKWGFE